MTDSSTHHLISKFIGLLRAKTRQKEEEHPIVEHLRTLAPLTYDETNGIVNFESGHQQINSFSEVQLPLSKIPYPDVKSSKNTETGPFISTGSTTCLLDITAYSNLFGSLVIEQKKQVMGVLDEGDEPASIIFLKGIDTTGTGLAYSVDGVIKKPGLPWNNQTHEIREKTVCVDIEIDGKKYHFKGQTKACTIYQSRRGHRDRTVKPIPYYCVRQKSEGSECVITRFMPADADPNKNPVSPSIEQVLDP